VLPRSEVENQSHATKYCCLVLTHAELVEAVPLFTLAHILGTDHDLGRRQTYLGRPLGREANWYFGRGIRSVSLEMSRGRRDHRRNHYITLQRAEAADTTSTGMINCRANFASGRERRIAGAVLAR
jgi:hypothetical protein